MHQGATINKIQSSSVISRHLQRYCPFQFTYIHHRGIIIVLKIKQYQH